MSGREMDVGREVPMPYSGKFSLGANFYDFRGQTCIRKNVNCEEMGIDDVIM